MQEGYTLEAKVKRDKYSRYVGNEYVDAYDTFVVETATKLAILENNIKDAAKAEADSITQKFEVYVRPSFKDGATHELVKVFANRDDFEDMIEKFGAYLPIDRYGSERTVPFYRKGNLLCTVDCHAGIVIDKTPCSLGDWARIESGDIPKVFLEKPKGNATMTVVVDPMKVKAQKLLDLGIKTLAEFDKWFAKNQKEEWRSLSYKEAYGRPLLELYLGGPPKTPVIDPLVEFVKTLSDDDKKRLLALLS